MRKFFIVTLVFLAATTLTLSGCGGDNGSGTVGTGSLTPTANPGTSSGGTSPSTSIGPPANVSLSSTLPAGSLLSQGGQTTITAVVTDSNGNSVTDGTVVNFSVSGGTIAASTTTTGGKASVTYEAGTSGGIVTVSATTTNGVSAELSIQVATGEAASIVTDSVTPATIGVVGSGTTQIATIKFQVLDSGGNPALDGTEVNFSIKTPLGGGESLSSTSGKTNGGTVTTALQSGTVSGTVTVMASLTTSAGDLISSEARVTIVGGRPDAEHISLARKYMNMAGGVTFGLQDPITAYLGDRYGNVVPDGTAVSFMSECGTIGQSAGFSASTSYGVASAVLQTSDPTVPNLDGIGGTGNPGWCTIVAYTPGQESFEDNNGDGVFDAGDVCTKDLSEPYIDSNDNGKYDLGEKYIDANNNGQFDNADGTCEENTMIWASTTVLMSDYTAPINLSPTTFSLGIGQSQTFTYVVSDLWGNALVAGTTVKVTTTAGTLTGTTSVVQPDTIGPGVIYSFTLTSDLDTTAKEKVAEITVTITPPGSGDQGNNGTTIYEVAAGNINVP